MLCDTNIISELAKPKPNPGVIAWAEQQHHIALSTITIEEIQYGLAWKPNPRIKLWLDNFIQDFCDVLPITQRIAQIAGEIRGTLQAKGETRTQADMLIRGLPKLAGYINTIRATLTNTSSCSTP
jgi:predicted nucleic acid-binding protein